MIEFSFVLHAIKMKNKNISLRLSKFAQFKNLHDFKVKLIGLNPMHIMDICQIKSFLKKSRITKFV
jgi:hypothetical protein